MDERTIGRMHESTAGVLAYRHTGRRSESETDDDRNRPLVESDRRSGNLPTPRALQEGKQRRREDAASCYRTLRYRGEEEKAA